MVVYDADRTHDNYKPHEIHNLILILWNFNRVTDLLFYVNKYITY